jgi:phage/plasmid-like protein (TIGR03299 family)
MTNSFNQTSNTIDQAFARDGKGLMVYGNYRAAGYAVNPLSEVAGGTLVSADATPEAAFAQAGLTWTADTTDVGFTTPNGGDHYHPTAAYKSIVRSDTGGLLAIHGPSYTPVQNHELRGIFDALAGRTQIEDVLSINEGERVYITATINAQNDVLPGDVVRRYLHLSNGHKGSSLRAFFTDRRMFCANQMAYFDGTVFNQANKKGEALKHRHSRGITDFVRRLPGLIDAEIQQFHTTIEGFRAMADVQVTPEQAAHVLSATFADRLAVPLRDRNSADRTAMRKRTLDDLTDEVETIRSHAYGDTGIGFDVPGMRGSLWGLYNAITQYTTWDTARAKDPLDRARGRLEALYGGAGSQRIERAREACLQLV